MNGPNGKEQPRIGIPVPILGHSQPKPAETHIFVRMVDGTERVYAAGAFGLDPAGDLLIIVGNQPLAALSSGEWAEVRTGDFAPIVVGE